MGITIYDRVQETTNSSGTGAISLEGAVPGFISFNDTVGVGNQTYYGIIDNAANDWEIGIGTLTSSETLSRDTVISSSNNGDFIDFVGNISQVFLDVPASKRIQIDSPTIGNDESTVFYGDGSHLTGITGTQGSQGVAGSQGHQGTSGSPGNQGAAGTQGSQGHQGAAGEGTQGVQGPQGAAGIGTQGAIGVGSQGPQGTQGASGGGGGLSLPIDVGNTTTIITSTGEGSPTLFGTDGNWNPYLTSADGSASYQFDSSNNPLVTNSGGGHVFAVDANGNGMVLPNAPGYDAASFSFDSGGQPQILNETGTPVIGINDLQPFMQTYSGYGIFSFDDSNNPYIWNDIGYPIFDIDTYGHPQFYNGGGNQVIGIDENYNVYLDPVSGNGSIGFDSNGNILVNNSDGTNIIFVDGNDNPGLSSGTNFGYDSGIIGFDSNCNPHMMNVNGIEMFGCDLGSNRPTIAGNIYPTDSQGALINDGSGNLSWGEPYRQVNAQTGTSYTLTIGDQMVTLDNTSAITVTVPAATFPVLTEIDLVQLGTGLVTVVAAEGVTVNSYLGNLSLAGQYAAATLKELSADNWILIGNLS